MPIGMRSGNSRASRATSLPISADFGDDAAYVESLLSFITSNELFQTLCGGVHVLDFFTREPDLYSTVLPREWREWFRYHDISSVLDLLLRESTHAIESTICQPHVPRPSDLKWRKGPHPPTSLLEYILSIRKHSMSRSFVENGLVRGQAPQESADILQHVSIGMKPKKRHEVEHFAGYINDLLISDLDDPCSNRITHIVDFGSGQNYLGRALASPPYHKNVIALESKQHNISGAKIMDITAKLSEKTKVMRNKKLQRKGFPHIQRQVSVTTPPTTPNIKEQSLATKSQSSAEIKQSLRSNGSIQYIETLIDGGDLSNILNHVNHVDASLSAQAGYHADLRLLVVSLHSCGNLLHHGLRSIVLNPAVKAVAMVGCCYNLVTEKFGPPSFKVPSLRSSNLRLDQTSSAYDPHGFPMSERLAAYRHHGGHGVRFNITARMMAVQAPENWTTTECESFFTRHFYRALLQRILFDRGIVGRPPNDDISGTNPQGWTGAGPALTIGSLRKACYTSFTAYVRGAVAKLVEDPQRGTEISQLMNDIDDEEIDSYEEKFRAKKHELSVVWALMAFSATVVESAIVTDRWLYLQEQVNVKDSWVETVFDYKQSPRNLVVVGIKH